MTECKKCGKCCEVIHIPFSYQEVTERRIYPEYNKIFILQHWKEIDPIEVWHLSPDNPLRGYNNYLHYYKCDQYDMFNHVCMCHDTKPPICTDYPGYGILHSTNAEFPECGYNEGVTE